MSGILTGYVINLDKNKDRWEDINIDFKETGFNLKRWLGTDGETIPDNIVDKKCTTSCKYMCTAGMIGIWDSHYRLWNYIVENKETNVLILHDNVVPVNNFKTKFIEYLKDLPKDWDLIFLGCYGSCKKDSNLSYLLETVHDRENQTKTKHLFRPSFPLGFYGYLLSYNGAKKLLKYQSLKQINTHIDYQFAKEVCQDKNFKLFAVDPPLILTDVIGNSNKVVANSLFSFVTDHIYIMDDITLTKFLNYHILDYRPNSIMINNFTILLAVLAFLVSYLCDDRKIKIFSFVVLGYLCTEVAFTKTCQRKSGAIALQLFLTVFMLALGYRLKRYRQH